MQNNSSIATLISTIAMLSMIEATLAQKIEFQVLDEDEDGLLSVEEVQTLYPEMTDEEILAMDANDNGGLDLEEYEALTAG